MEKNYISHFPIQVKEAATDLILIQMYCEPCNSRPYKTAGKQERAFTELVLNNIYLGKIGKPFEDAFKAYISGEQDGIRRTAAVIDGKEQDKTDIFPAIDSTTISEYRRRVSRFRDVVSDSED